MNEITELGCLGFEIFDMASWRRSHCVWLKYFAAPKPGMPVAD